ncbi:MAG: polyprenyl synthetase [Candidatus Marinimicrobia bacterium CG08_land_8_20_14_0_20_45_22]|nr:MAG: polyprenyl synthetase [Candidatus Marinimicrobia bacterium CG08_land_8_20_14_0_20_45_22]
MNQTLKLLLRPIENEMSRFATEFESALRSDVHLIEQMTHYLIKQNSKRLRPALLLLSAKLCGGPNRISSISASIVEMLHTATLVHDDIVDDSITRRGEPTVNAIWKNKVSVLLGDYLFSKSLRSMLSLRNFEALELLSETSELLSSGEIYQIEKSMTNGINEDSYYRMIWAKTACLFATSCKIGAISVNGTDEQTAHLYEYGRNLGMAFQIKDDLFDFSGEKRRVGKPVDRDIKSNLITLPLIYTLKNLSESERTLLRKNLRENPSGREIRNIRATVQRNGGLKFAQEKMHEYSTSARSALDIFPDSDTKESLIGLIEFNEQRKS